MANNFAPELLSSPKTIGALVLLYLLLGRPGRGEGEGEGGGKERQPGVAADWGRGSGAVIPVPELPWKSPAPEPAVPGQAGLRERGWAGVDVPGPELFQLPRDRAVEGASSERNHPWSVLCGCHSGIISLLI